MIPTVAVVGRTLLGRYTIERELGRGGMAAVFLALDQQTGTKVAVKILDQDLSASLGATRFLREIQVASLLKHPNILGVLDSGDEDGLLFYVMPLVEGESLEARLLRDKQLPIDESINIAVQVASALEFAHSHAVLHRDIKPANILLTGKHAFLSDFGIAKAVTEAGGEKLTQTGMTVGTPMYMSPEQATGSRDLTPSSDVYSLGCVVYEMLTGQPPFTGPTAMALMAKHSLEQVPSIRIVRSSVADVVEDAVLCALEKTPADRFATAREFAAALTGQTHRSPPSKTGQRVAVLPPAPGLTSTRRVVYAAGVAAILAVAGWGVWRATHGSVAPERIGTDSDPNHIAVLYFDDLSKNGELRPLADGFTEALIAELSPVKPFKVISRNGVAAYRKTNVPIDSVGRALKVGTIVSGSVAQSDDRLRVHVSVEDALTKEEIGSTTIDRPRSDLFALQDELATEVARFLRKQVGHEIENLVSRSGSRNSLAWEAMQRAMQTQAGATPLLNEGNVDAARRQLVQADSELAQVQTIDAKWAAPVTQRAWISYRLARLLGPGDPSEYAKNIDVGLTHATQAVTLGPNDPDALEVRAMLQYLRWLLNLAPDAAAADKLLADAEAGFRAAIAANPLQASAWNTLSHLLINKSQTAQAKLAAQTAYESDPYLSDVDKTIHRLFLSSLDLGSRAEATKWCATGQQRFPNDFRFVECKLWLYSMLGQKPSADSIWATYNAYIQASPANLKEFDRRKGGMIAAIGLVRAGLPDSARRVMVKSRADDQLDPTGELVNIEAIGRAQVGDKDESIRLLARYLAANPQQRASGRPDDTWWLDPIREDPRFKALFSGTSPQ